VGAHLCITAWTSWKNGSRGHREGEEEVEKVLSPQRPYGERRWRVSNT